MSIFLGQSCRTYIHNALYCSTADFETCVFLSQRHWIFPSTLIIWKRSLNPEANERDHWLLLYGAFHTWRPHHSWIFLSSPPFLHFHATSLTELPYFVCISITTPPLSADVINGSSLQWRERDRVMAVSLSLSLSLSRYSKRGPLTIARCVHWYMIPVKKRRREMGERKYSV